MCYKIWSSLYMSSYFCRHFSGFSLIMMFRFHGSVDLSACCGEWAHTQAVGEERNEYRCLFPWLVQYGDTGKCPSFCCKDFFMICLNCRFMFKSIFNSTVRSVPSAITCDRPGSVDAWITIRVKGVGVCCVPNCVAVHLAVWLQGETEQTETSYFWY
jgi:hypothetical protein